MSNNETVEAEDPFLDVVEIASEASDDLADDFYDAVTTEEKDVNTATDPSNMHQDIPQSAESPEKDPDVDPLMARLEEESLLPEEELKV